MNLADLAGQLSASSNPLGMVMSMLPNQNLKDVFSGLANSNSDMERAQKIADICNRNGITKAQLQQALQRKRF